MVNYTVFMVNHKGRVKQTSLKYSIAKVKIIELSSFLNETYFLE